MGKPLLENISIIIVNYKSWKSLDRCLQSIEKINLANIALEVIVVDNHSNDDKIDEYTKKYSDFKFILNAGNNGFANACNLGARKSKGKYLLFLNPDTEITENALLDLYNFYKSNNDCGIVSCKQKNENSFEKMYRYFPEFNTIFGFLRAMNKKLLQSKTIKTKEVLYPDWVSGAVFFISKAWFNKVNGWNEDYWMYFEDVDLSKKVRNAGGEIALLTNTTIYHLQGGASRINLKTASITKTEVLISKHVYIKNHFSGYNYLILQLLLVTQTFLNKLIGAILGVFLFFIPKMRLNIILFYKITRYYIFAIVNSTWLSPKSMNFKRT